jgi:hypothetical protein
MGSVTKMYATLSPTPPNHFVGYNQAYTVGHRLRTLAVLKMPSSIGSLRFFPSNLIADTCNIDASTPIYFWATRKVLGCDMFTDGGAREDFAGRTGCSPH